MTMSKPSDSGRPYFSSMRSASWTISAISVSTASSSSSYSLRNVSKEQSSPRWESLAPTTSKSSAPSGASAGSSKKAKEGSGSTKRRISQTQAVRSTWQPRRVAQSAIGGSIALIFTSQRDNSEHCNHVYPRDQE